MAATTATVSVLHRRYCRAINAVELELLPAELKLLPAEMLSPQTSQIGWSRHHVELSFVVAAVTQEAPGHAVFSSSLFGCRHFFGAFMKVSRICALLCLFTLLLLPLPLYCVAVLFLTSVSTASVYQRLQCTQTPQTYKVRESAVNTMAKKSQLPGNKLSIPDGCWPSAVSFLFLQEKKINY